MSKRSQHMQPEDVSLSVQVLRYRGGFYTQKQRASNLRLTNAQVAHLLNDSAQLDINPRNCAMHIQRMGFLYKLYCMGWINGSLKCFPVYQHWLLIIFRDYRRGYIEGSKWRSQNYLASLETEIGVEPR